MKVLFLDMDGVVNSARYFEVLSKRQYRKARGKAKADGLSKRSFVDMIDPAAIPHLNAIVERTGCLVVISSSWRVPWHWKEIEAMLDARGFQGNVIDATPIDNSPYRYDATGAPIYDRRGCEIQQWLDANPVDAFAIIDDSDDMAHLSDRLVRTTWAEGIQAEHVEQVVRLLGEVRSKMCGVE